MVNHDRGGEEPLVARFERITSGPDSLPLTLSEHPGFGGLGPNQRLYSPGTEIGRQYHTQIPRSDGIIEAVRVTTLTTSGHAILGELMQTSAPVCTLEVALNGPRLRPRGQETSQFAVLILNFNSLDQLLGLAVRQGLALDSAFVESYVTSCARWGVRVLMEDRRIRVSVVRKWHELINLSLNNLP